MENASKALLIAGGILITIIIVSVFMLMYDQLKSIPQTQEQIKSAEQLAEFNKKYESYNKNKMYGADIITVINMARNNNKTYLNDDKYQIQINVKITSSIDSRIRMWYYDTAESDSSKAVKEATADGWPKTQSSRISEGEYDISNKMWNDILDSTSGEVQSEYVYTDEYGNLTYKTVKWSKNVSYNSKKYDVYYMKSNLAYEFKNRKFKCTGIGYGENGRVNKLSFEQI